MLASSLIPATVPHPASRIIPARDEYHGVVVVDEHRWLEAGDDPAVKAWTEAQNRRTRDHLDAINDRD
jgi:protease II